MKAINLCVIFVAFLAASEATFLSPHLGEKLFQKQLGNGQEYKSKNVRETVFTQWTDHFNLGAGTFEQTIFINDQFYNLGGPVFIYISSYGGAEEYWLEESYITQIAEEQRGVIYAIQPRFFGNSRPTPDTSLESLQLLTINQTMNDIVTVTRFLRSALADFGSDRFILFGYDKGATLATFTHQRNPGLFNGVWASSAPTEVFFNFDNYFYDIRVLADQYLNRTCITILQNSDNELEGLISAGNSARITELFNFDGGINLSEPKQISLLFYVTHLLVANHFEWGTQVGRDDFCQSIEQSVNNGASDLEALAIYLNPVIGGLNLDVDSAVEYMRETSWDSQGSRFGERQIWYTTCTEWSWFKTSYGLPVDARYRFTEYFFSDICYDIFGITLSQTLAGNEQTRAGLRLNPAIQNVFFTFGGTDTFRLLGITSDLNVWTSGEVIPGFGKAFDLLGSISADSITPELTQVRSNVRSRILSWIGV